MKLTFLGGSVEVGSTALLIENDGFKGIFDYGLAPTTPPKYPLEPPSVDYIFLTHAHLDHSGMIPWLTRQYQVPFYTSLMTYNISKIMLEDNLRVSALEGFPVKYSKKDIVMMDEELWSVESNSSYNLFNSTLNVHSAGHIPGANMFTIKFNDDQKVLYTGDINTIDTRLIAGTTGKKCDILIMESTYGGRDHKLRQQIEYEFLEDIKEVIDRGGKVIIPAFAVGRTQEILLIIADLGYDVWLDGLGNRITKVILDKPKFIKNDKKLKKIFHNIHHVRKHPQRNNALKGDIILTTSGMLDGGPVQGYIKQLNNNPKNAIFLTGYQVEGSNGRRLLENGMIYINGEKEKVNLKVKYFDFSAHSGHKELIEFAKNCKPEHIILFHGDNREALRNELSDRYQVHLPVDGKTVEI